TLGAAILITWRGRDNRTDFAHNLAVVFWISANAWWMIAEFFEFDESPLWFGISGRHLALIPFACGALTLLQHYGAALLQRRCAVDDRGAPLCELHPVGFHAELVLQPGCIGE